MHSAANLGPLPEGAAIRYSVDPAASKFTVRASASGWLSAFGHDPEIAIRGFSGEVEVDPNAIESSSLVIRVDPASLQVLNKMSDRDCKEIERITHEEVLLAGSFPEITYECSQVTATASREGRYWVALNGQLTLRGITKAQTVPASVMLTDDGLRAKGDFSLRQTEYDIKPYSAMGGGLVVKDELKFNFDVVARKS